MRKFASYLLSGLVAVSLVASASAAPNPQKPGKWKVKMQMEMPGMPIKLPATTVEICLSEEDLNNPQKAVPTDPKSDCTVSDYEVDGNSVSWTMECPKQKMKGDGKITVDGDTYTGVMRMQMDEQEMTMKYTGQWVGECKK